jgi:UDP-N-acetylmuramyl tripeptide synthase
MSRAAWRATRTFASPPSRGAVLDAAGHRGLACDNGRVLLLNARPATPGTFEPTSRQRLALWLGRLAGIASRALGRGGGTALPGLVALRVAPDLVRLLGRAERGAVTVTGTNGKTTTAHLLTEAAASAGLEVLTNRSGSNLERGLASTLVDAATPVGGLPSREQRLAVLELDEAAWPALLPDLRPRVAVFLNLFRDQLDRYGELDAIAEAWRDALEREGCGPALVLNADDPSVALLAEVARNEVVCFGVDDASVALPEAEHASDARFCPCGATFEYAARYIGHVGDWHCPGCGRARPPRTVSARHVRLSEDGVRFELVTPAGVTEVSLPLAGLHSVYNALAVAAAALALGLPQEATTATLARAVPAFGRQERFTLDGHEVRVLLAKNPAGLNELLRALAAAAPPLSLLWLLNDGIQDGQDVSWIYDADVEALEGRVGTLVVSGARADDLALRLHLGGLTPTEVLTDVETALDAALAATPEGDRLDIVATYTAMLEVREVLARRAGTGHYWEAVPPPPAPAPAPAPPEVPAGVR